MLSELLPFFLQAPAATPDHTYRISCGSRSGIIGYWFNNIGSVNDETYTLPNGVSATVRQTMTGSPIGSNELRFLLNACGLGTGDTDQFPTRIEVENSRGSRLEFIPKSPIEISSFGQGIGQDYRIVSGGVGTLFVNNAPLTVNLYY